MSDRDPYIDTWLYTARGDSALRILDAACIYVWRERREEYYALPEYTARKIYIGFPSIWGGPMMRGHIEWYPTLEPQRVLTVYVDDVREAEFRARFP